MITYLPIRSGTSGASDFRFGAFIFEVRRGSTGSVYLEQDLHYIVDAQEVVRDAIGGQRTGALDVFRDDVVAALLFPGIVDRQDVRVLQHPHHVRFTQEHLARRLGEHDHPGIVWDEIVGFLAMMLVAPTGWSWIAAGFVLFRVFDIFKPWPIRDLDHRIRGGLGIMLDDMLAAAYAAVGLFALQLFLNAWSA